MTQIEQWLREEGREEGLKEGELKGKLESKLEGKLEGMLEAAKNALLEGLEPQTVAKITGLPLETIQKIKAEILS